MISRRVLLILRNALLAAILVAMPQTVFADSDPFDGVWELNLAKSKYSPGPEPKAQTLYMRGEEQNRSGILLVERISRITTDHRHDG
jgi:hypothetical protein